MKAELVEQASKIIPEPQMLINVVSRRVAQLNNGRAPLVPTTPHMGNANIALTEIIARQARLSYGIRQPPGRQPVTTHSLYCRSGPEFRTESSLSSQAPVLPARGLFILLPFVP